MSDKDIWKQAWSRVQARSAPDTPDRALYKKAERLWKSWLQTKHEQQEEASTFTESTTLGVMARLLAGVDKAGDDEPLARTNLFTTTTRNVEVQKALDKITAMKEAAIARLTKGMAEASIAEVQLAAKTTTTSTTTTTTTTNTAMSLLLAGVDGPAASTRAAHGAETTTTATTTTTTTSKLVLDATARKTIAFISSGTFEAWPRKAAAAAEAESSEDDQKDDDQKDDEQKAEEDQKDSEAAADFDNYDS